jgi:uncharacterized damage-inducible protein DinB
MNTECLRIADQLRRAFDGDAWHGDSLFELLNGIPAAQAAAYPVSSAHSIWELVLHIELYAEIARGALEGQPMPKLYVTGEDWRVVTDQSPEAWRLTLDSLFRTKDRLATAIGGLSDARLTEIAPGRDYDFYHLLHGIVQHSLYHGGQIALLKKAEKRN